MSFFGGLVDTPLHTRKSAKGGQMLDIVKQNLVRLRHGGRGMVIWDMAKWRKMKEFLDEEIAYTGMVAIEGKDLNEERKMYLEGYRNALNYVKSKFECINEEYEGYKRESVKRGEGKWKSEKKG